MTNKIGKVNREKVRENARKVKDGKSDRFYPTNFGKFQQLELKEKYNTLNILNYKVTKSGHPDGVKVGEYWYKRPYAIHTNVNNGDPILCMRGTYGKPCPLCELRSKMFNTNKAVADLLRPKKLDLFAVLNDNGEIQILDISNFLFGKDLAKEIDLEEDLCTLGDYDEDGRTLRVRMDKDSYQNHDYLVLARVDYKNRKALKAEVIDNIPSLDEMFVIPSLEELKAIAKELNTDPSNTEDVWEDEKQEAETEVEESVEEKVEEEEEEKAKEKPARKKRTTKKKEEPKPEPEPEPDFTDEDDEEEESDDDDTWLDEDEDF